MLSVHISGRSTWPYTRTILYEFGVNAHPHPDLERTCMYCTRGVGVYSECYGSSVVTSKFALVYLNFMRIVFGFLINLFQRATKCIDMNRAQFRGGPGSPGTPTKYSTLVFDCLYQYTAECIR